MLHPRNLRLSALAILAVGASSANAELLYGISQLASGASTLVTFDSASPSTFTTGSAITGVVAGQTLRGIDFRPSTGELFAVSSLANATTGSAQLYTVNLATGALTTVGSGFALPGASTRVSLDFNPTNDLLRLITGGNLNFSVNPTTGVATQQTSITNSAGGTPLIAGIAYTNNVAGATSTTLNAYEFVTDTIGTIVPPGGGVYTPTGSIAPFSAFNASVGFDISGATGAAYISFDEFVSPAGNAELFTVNLATGSLTQVGADEPLGNATIGAIVDISVQPVNPVPEPATMAALGLGALALLKRRRKA